MMCVGLTPSYNIASIISTAFYNIWNLVPHPRTPIWWRWYCWGCPMAWTLYGLVVSLYGDITTPMEDGRLVKVFLEDYFDFKHSWLGWAAILLWLSACSSQHCSPSPS